MSESASQVLPTSARGQDIFVQRGTGNENLKKYVVQGDTTVGQLKGMIAEKEGDCSADDIELIWGGRQLDDKATISENHLQDGTQIKLVLRVVNKAPPPPAEGEVQIFVKTPQDTTHTINVKRTDKVSVLRAKIHDKTGIEPEFQRLIYGGKDLRADDAGGDEQTLADYFVEGGSTVHMVLRLKGGM